MTLATAVSLESVTSLHRGPVGPGVGVVVISDVPLSYGLLLEGIRFPTCRLPPAARRPPPAAVVRPTA